MPRGAIREQIAGDEPEANNSGGRAPPPWLSDEESRVCEAGQCGTGLHCEAIIGQCDGPGEYSETSMLCGLIPGGDIPVCGCDGTTFEFQCHAQQADMPVAAWGECDG